MTMIGCSSDGQMDDTKFSFRSRNGNILIGDDESDSILGGLDVHLHLVLPLGIVFSSEVWWSCERFSLSDELALVICHLDLFLQTLLST